MFWRSGTKRSEGAQKYAAAVFIPLFYGARPPRAAPSAFRFNVVVVVVVVVVLSFLIVVAVGFVFCVSSLGFRPS